MHSNRELWYDRPARYWEEALALGNGRLGAMLYSGIKEDLILMNEDTLWSGYPRDTVLPGAFPHYERARDLALAGRYEEAERETEEHLLGEYTNSYLPAGGVRLCFPELADDVGAYTRSLQLETAQVESSFRCKETVYRKEAFISVPEQALYLKLTADKKGGLTFCVAAESLLRSRCHVEEKMLVLTGIAPSYVEPSYIREENPVIYSEEDSQKGMRFMMIVSVETTNGTVEGTENGLSVIRADEAVIRICIRTSFCGFMRQPYTQGADESALCRADMEHAKSVDYETAKSRHRSEYMPYFDSADLILDDSDAGELPTDQRIRSFYPEGADVGLYELFFHYGRYLLIACSRPGTQAANLQGIWNAKVRPPWSSNYTVNINTQMNYWGAEICGLSELHEPLFALIRELAATGGRTAREYYGADGFVCHHNTDLWRLTTPVGRKGRGAASYAFWPMAAGWLCRHLYEHYQYTLDQSFLEETAYPLLYKAAKFYADVLVEDGAGWLVFAPSTSPENRYRKGDFNGALSVTTAMTMSIIREVFEECVQAAGKLGKEDSFIQTLSDKLKRLRPLQTGSDGRILEWAGEFAETDPGHRHLSHLYALYPGRMIDPEKEPLLAEACKRSLEARGDAGTGWSLSWKVNLWVRLGDGAHALKLLREQLRFVPCRDMPEDSDEFNYHDGGGVYANLFDAHPPFQIDGNLGSLSGIAEMFLGSDEDAIYLLPALPDAFRSGSVRGIRAMGRVTADLRFENGSLTKAVISTDTAQERTLVYGGKRQKISLKPGVPFIYTHQSC